jgi:putative methyltransferase (TIGR04325 family)
MSTGYDSAEIVERVLAATLAVRAGRAAYERDGVVFAEPANDEPLLAALKEVALRCDGGLRVIDVGGALGSTYWRHRCWLETLRELRWDVVEQPAFVEAGRKHLADTPLRFFETIAAAEAEASHHVLLASGVVQYLEAPDSTVAEWLEWRLPFLVFNNLPLHRRAPDRLTVQHVPARIYAASYPVWFFNRERFLVRFEGRYEIIREFASEAVWRVGWREYRSSGLLLRRDEAR